MRRQGRCLGVFGERLAADFDVDRAERAFGVNLVDAAVGVGIGDEAGLGIREEVHDALTGHAPRYSGRKYGSGILLTILSRHMKTVEYPGLNLEHLYQQESDPA